MGAQGLEKLYEGVRELKDEADASFGEGDVLRPLFKKCYKRTVSGFEYEACLFDKVTQRDANPESKKGGFQPPAVLLGTYNSADVGAGRMHFSEGHVCGAHGARKAFVELVCGVREEVLGVEEWETCKYAVKLATPAGCTQAAVDEAGRKLQEGLAMLRDVDKDWVERRNEL